MGPIGVQKPDRIRDSGFGAKNEIDEPGFPDCWGFRFRVRFESDHGSPEFGQMAPIGVQKSDRSQESASTGEALECGPSADGLPLFPLGGTSLLAGMRPRTQMTTSKLADGIVETQLHPRASSRRIKRRQAAALQRKELNPSVGGLAHPASLVLYLPAWTSKKPWSLF